MFILSTKMRHFIMGAFNKDKQYTIPQNAIKGQTYECPECKGRGKKLNDISHLFVCINKSKTAII